MQQFLMANWAKFTNFIHSTPFINYGFCMNDGIWIHIIGGAILSKIIRIKFSYLATIFIILGIAITWEIIEIYIETPNMAAMLAIYGSQTRYIYDTIGDILGAVVITIIANYPSKEA
jgi:hypothetical protein